MSKKCSFCGKTKGKRGCRLHDMKMICPRCCANIRNAECDPCSYYRTAENYQAEKYQKSGGQSFTIELDETVEKEIDKALGEVERKRFAKAEKILAPLFQSHPNNHYVQYGLGALYAFKGENRKAVEHFQKAIEIFPFFVEAYYNLGIAYTKEVNIAGMVRAFRRVVSLAEPDDLVYREAKGMLSLLEQSVREVNGTDLDTFIKAQDFFEKGMVLMETGKWEEAIDTYKKSLTLNATTPQPYGNMGICYAKMGKKEAAIEAFDRALGIDPNYELAIVNKALTAGLASGETLDAPMSTIEYYKDYKEKNRSYIEEFTKEMKRLMEGPRSKM
jgi:tetratricopeptide (TPR) repeat protein